MNKKLYYEIAEKTFHHLEEWLDTHESGADYERPQSGVIEIETAAGDIILINMHLPTQEIWVAAPTGAFHFCWQEDKGEGKWRDTRDGIELFEAIESMLPHRDSRN